MSHPVVRALERALQHTRAQAALARSDDSSRAVREIVGGADHPPKRRTVARTADRAVLIVPSLVVPS